MSFEDLFNSIKKIAGDIKCLITKVDIIAGAGTGTQDYEAGNYTLLCDSANPNIYYLAYFTSIDGVKENHYITLPSGVDTVGNLPATAMPCKEPKVITSCYKANGVLYTHVLCLSGTSIVSSLWINMSNNSTSTTAPAGAVSCSDPIVVCTKDLCAEIEPEVSPTQGAGLITGFINQEDFSSYANGTYTTINNTIGGTNFSIQHRDFNAANPLLGTLRSFIVESPISQNGANLPQKGIETIGGGTATFNAFVISFTTPVSAFGANILDAESNTTFGEAQVIAYDSSFNVLHSETLPSGANLVRWVKLQSTLNNISYVAIKVGDEIGGTLSDQVAVTNISFETTLAAGLTEIKEIIFYENGQLITKYYNKLTGQEILDISGLTFINCNPEPIPDFLAIRIPICVNGVNHVQQVVYLDGVLQSGATYYDMNGDPVTAPANFTLGWCEPVDYEIITSGVCIGGQNGIKKEFYEDEILIATEFSINGTIVVPSNYTDGYCNVKTVIAVEPHCATRNTGGTAYCLVYKGSYQDYLNAGGDPNGVYLGTFSEPNYDGWSYIGLCAASLPDPIDGWEWSTIKDPIYGYNGGNQYGPLTLVPSGNAFSCGITRKNIEKIKHSDNSIRWVEDSSDLQNLIDFDTTGWDVVPGICPVPIIPEIDLIKDNWLPYCVDGIQWYVKEVSTFNNNTAIESTPTKIYKQGADGTIVTTAPTGTVIEEGYCSIKTSCASVGDVTAIPSKVLSKTEIDTIMFNLLGANVPKQYAPFSSIYFPQTINYQGTSGNIFFGYNVDLGKYKCGKNVKADIKLMYTPLGDSDPVDNGLDIIFLAANQSYTPLDFTSIIDGTAFPAFPTKVITKLYPTLPTTIQTIAAGYDISGLDSINILSYVQGMSATDKVQIEGIYLEIVSGDFSECGFVLPVQDCNSEPILNALRTLVEQATQKIKRVPEMFPGSGTTPLVIPEGAISISITRLSGTVKVKGYNGQDFLLTATNENFYDGVNEAVSILGAYTIEGATSTSSYKIHILR